MTFDEAEALVTQAICESDERVALAVVHDANMASDALDAGCVDLVVGGHTHVLDGPNLVVGENGERGYDLTNGTSGGATFSLALGRKLQKEASSVVVTFKDGRPVGTQPVRYLTDGRVVVGTYQELILSDDSKEDSSDSASNGEQKEKALRQ